VSTVNPSLPAATPVVISLSRSLLWLGITAALALAVYYFVGIDQGATSVFGNDSHIHEFVHDSRHFLGFPCH
jgi:Probable cobalt transporter subunit (CbtB)